MIRELCKHFFQKSLRICKCAGRSVCPAPNRCCLPARPRAWAIFCYALRAAKYRSPCGMRREATPIRGLPTHTPSTVLKHVLGLMQIWWLGKAEPLYKEAGAKAPASLNFLLDKVSDQEIAPLCSGNTGPVLDLVFRTFRRPGNPLIRSSEGAG